MAAIKARVAQPASNLLFMKAQVLRSMIGFCLGVGWGIISLNATPDIPAPLFELSRWQSEESVKLNDYQGGIVVLDFFAYWCVPCLTTSTDLEDSIQNYYSELDGNSHRVPVRVMSINIESSYPKKTEQFINKTGVSFVLNDSDGAIYKKFGGRGLPFLVVLDGTSASTQGDGWKIAYQHTGYEGAAKIRAIINALGDSQFSSTPSNDRIRNDETSLIPSTKASIESDHSNVVINIPEKDTFIDHLEDQHEQHHISATADSESSSSVRQNRGTLRTHYLEPFVEVLWSSDIFLVENNLDYRVTGPNADFGLGVSYGIIDIDYEPFAAADLVGFPTHLSEGRPSFLLSYSRNLNPMVVLSATAGGYKGITDHRSLWLDEYYRQQFSGIEGYLAADPRGINFSLGLRWEYIPGNGFIEVTGSYSEDYISPGYERILFEPLFRGIDFLKSTSIGVNLENVLTPRLRSLQQFQFIDTTSRELRFSYQGSLNWAIKESWVLRTVGGATVEDDANRGTFNSYSVGVNLEYDWNETWFLSVAARYYQDNGQIEESLLVDSGVPPLHTFQSGITLRWQGEKSSLKIIAQPYFTRFDTVERDVAPFANLYADRNWGLFGITYSRGF